MPPRLRFGAGMRITGRSRDSTPIAPGLKNRGLRSTRKRAAAHHVVSQIRTIDSNQLLAGNVTGTLRVPSAAAPKRPHESTHGCKQMAPSMQITAAKQLHERRHTERACATDQKRRLTLFRMLRF